MSIKARLKRLEKKIAAAEVPGVEIGVFAGEPIWCEEEHEDMLRCFSLHSSEQFAAMASRQQSELMTRLTEYDAAIDAEEGKATVSVGADDQIAPGHVKPNFIFRMEGGKEIQIDTRTGERTVV